MEQPAEGWPEETGLTHEADVGPDGRSHEDTEREVPIGSMRNDDEYDAGQFMRVASHNFPTE